MHNENDQQKLQQKPSMEMPNTLTDAAFGDEGSVEERADREASNEIESTSCAATALPGTNDSNDIIHESHIGTTATADISTSLLTALQPDEMESPPVPSETMPSNPESTEADVSGALDDGSVKSIAGATSTQQSKSAQILMDRFSSWRKLANVNAQALLEKTKKSSTQWTLATPSLRNFTDPTVSGSAAENTTSNEESKDHALPDDSLPLNDDNLSKATTTDFVTSTGNDNESQQHRSSVSSTAPVPPPPSTPPPPLTSERAVRVNMEPLEQRMADAAVAVKVAASVVADSVATGFRGRYSGRTVVDAIKPRRAKQPPSPLIESQTALILKSRAASHMQSILDHLDSHEYVMLLGPGMFGVNLKQTYLKSHGVYVDYLVKGGAAQKSAVVHVGDLMVKVGDFDVRKGTILTVPKTIATAKRPVILVLCTGTKTVLDRINYIDVAVAMMHRIRHGTAEDSDEEDQAEDDRAEAGHNNQDEVRYVETSTRSSPPREKSEVADECDEKKDMEANEWNTPVKNSKPVYSLNTTTLVSPPIPFETSVASFINPSVPPMSVREFFALDIAKRCNETVSSFLLRQALNTDANFRKCLQNAFLTCVIDGRRFPFLARHLSSGTEGIESEEDTNTVTSTSTPGSALLMLFLEMMTFVDLYGVTPPSRRREIAHRIAYKFFLPTKVGNNLERPLFDFHHIVNDSSLRRLERALVENNPEGLSRDVFMDFQQAVLESLSGSTFLSFLMSHECARMRAYLRNTALFVNVPLQEVIDGVVASKVPDNQLVGWASTAKNHFLYMLVHLLCQTDKDSCGEVDDCSGDTLRMSEAASGLCCALFIRRDLTPFINQAKLMRSSASTAESIKSISLSLFDALRRLWNIFLAPTSRSLVNYGYSNETDDALTHVRCLVQDILSGVPNDATDEDIVEIAIQVGDSNLIVEAHRLADELIYDYAVNSHSKYRDHKFHEWMCSELGKCSAIDAPANEQSCLPSGCIKRLLRRVEFPPGVSSHKPVRVAIKNTSQRCYPNADFAVVFGTSTGTDLANQTPNPAMDNYDVRRFACQSVALDKPHNSDDFDVAQVPITLESYAVYSPAAARPFADFRLDCNLSNDGWEASLVNFMIPNADNSSENNLESSSLYGVSLVLQKTGDHTAASKSSFAGKLDLPDTKRAESTEIPVFNQRLCERRWSEIRSAGKWGVATNLVIGIALVSHQNVIPAMRDSLTHLFSERCRISDGQRESFACNSFVDTLGNFANQDVEPFALKCVLEPYLKRASTPWIERPLSDQKETFDAFAGEQLICSLGPTPLALLLVTVLLEQKVVLSSSRHSMLLYSTSAISRLIEPLKWCHLWVPLVPSALGRDLIQYPAPFIIGMPSEDPANVELLNNLPNDVTLVDLDVGRVILAPSFSQDLDSLRGDENVDVTSNALRSQVLYLAQALGGIIGANLHEQAWRCDSPLSSLSPELNVSVKRGFDSVRNVCGEFVSELLEGAAACCYWIEEANETEDDRDPSVLFDEDRFLHIKNIRAQRQNDAIFYGPQTKADTRLALRLDDFDLVLGNFLRGQSMSSYVSALPRKDMVYY